jgi:UDP-N-acetyl-2-amino-2-deoxyglucuronate dehydrogenase
MAKKKSTYGFGIIGCGMIADFHAKALEQVRGGKLVACYDVRPEGVERVSKAFGATPYTDMKAFLAHPGLDIVTIATPSGAHMEPCLAAAKAGKHVICEKPLEVTLERCDRMIAACKKARVLLAGVFQSRVSGAVNALKKAVDQGRFGRISLADASVKWFRPQSYYDSGAWRGTYKLDGGGALMNQSIHTIDILQWLVGPIESIGAFADCLTHKRLETEDTAVAVLRFKNGALGVLEGATSATPGHPRQIQISGENGSVFLEDDKFTCWQFNKERKSDAAIMKEFGASSGGAGGGGAADPKAISIVGHVMLFQDLVRALKTGKKPTVDGVEARKSVEIILAVYQSAQTGKLVHLPLKRSPKLIRAATAAKQLRAKSKR